MINRHPGPDLLVEYASGSLSIAPCISITTHLQYCKQCCDSVESLGEIGGELLITSEALPVSDDLFDRILERVESVVEEVTPQAPHRHCSDTVSPQLPEFLQRLLPDGELDWRRLSPSLKVAPISIGEQEYELALHRIDAGGKAPEHDHGGKEITVVLTGSFSDEDGVYQPGDFLVRERGNTHRPFAARNQECICLSVLEAPIKLTGMKRVLNPFLSFTPS
ncbi:MAG: ChrR family anti-sigma-E factor [Proteobacteria bacterium]|nr:ChrR family anti-sigma-E factor [Pseudomonadota bacterium]